MRGEARRGWWRGSSDARGPGLRTSFSPSPSRSSASASAPRSCNSRLTPLRTNQPAPIELSRLRGAGVRVDKRRVGSDESIAAGSAVAEAPDSKGVAALAAPGSGVGAEPGSSCRAPGQRGHKVPQRRLLFAHCWHLRRPRLGRPPLFLGVGDSRASASPAASPARPIGQRASGGT